MVASPKEILRQWLIKYELYRGLDGADADTLRFYVDLMTDDQCRRFIAWLRRRKVSYIESACHEGGEMLLLRFETFRSHLRRKAAIAAELRAHEHDVPA